MTKVYLTDAFVRSAPAVPGRIVEYRDEKERGLALRVTPTGARSWTFRYRNLAGEQRRLSLGKLDAVPLAKARSLVIAERAKVADRQDPVALRKHERSEARRTSMLETVQQVGERYFSDAATGRHKPNAKRPKRPSTISLERSYFDKHVAPKLGKVRLVDLNRRQVQELIDDVASQASRSAARNCRVVLLALFNFAMWHEWATSNPCQYVSVPTFASRERVLSNAELAALWRGFEGASERRDLFVSAPLVLAFKLLAATLQRRAEVTGAKRSEFDLEARTWTIPGDRTKNHRTHIVPLSGMAVRLVAEAEELAADSQFLFPSPRIGAGDDRPIEPAALSHAFRRVCKAIDLGGIRPHDLRRTGATALTSEKLKVSRFIVSCVLNHASDTGGAAAVTAVYDQNTYLAEKRQALDAWTSELKNRLDAVFADGT